jgi:ribosome-interacting GTPase 1
MTASVSQVYLKPHGGEMTRRTADCPGGSIVADVRIATDFVQRFRYAQSGENPSTIRQRVGLPHKLIDSDPLTIIVEH